MRALLTGVVDYAGLFPPAALDVPEAADHYAAYRAGPERWMLGRFVVPAARLGDLVRVRARHADADRWPVSAIAGGSIADDVAAIERLDRGRPSLLVDSIEARLATPAEIERQAPAAAGYELFVEVPVREDPLPTLRAIRDVGALAKIRTGGVTADAFPTAREIARFMTRCAELSLPFKATAGLHHPIRATYRLTYAADAPSGTMFGFLNVFLAAAFVCAGATDDDAVAILEVTEPGAFAFDDDGVEWRGRRLSTAQLADARARYLRSFGSCSFAEPVGDLQTLSLLE